jgi:NAD(P)-dependent dehydrogenase (short-subunit alcohol dehydrogenase family)
MVLPVKTIDRDDDDDELLDDDFDSCTSTKTAGSSSSSAASSSIAGAADHDEKDNEEELIVLQQTVQRLLPALRKGETVEFQEKNPHERIAPAPHATTFTTITATTRIKTIVITGANSGIGLAAAKLLLLLADQQQVEWCQYRLVVVCRTQAKADWAAEQVRRVCVGGVTANPHRPQHVIIPLACDQTSLDDVYEFDQRIRAALAPHLTIDVLCLNAAVLHGHDEPPHFTVDGLERTLQVNYLSTFLLSNLLFDLVSAAAGPNGGGRIIFSTSGLHETTPLHNIHGMRQQLSFLLQLQQQQQHEPQQRQPDAHDANGNCCAMPDGTPYHYKRAYALSKTLMARHCAELQRRCRRPVSDKHVAVNCFSPGLMLDTGLFRHQSMDGVAKLRQHNPHAMANAKSVHWGAGALVYMAMTNATGDSTAGGRYWSDRDSQLGDDALYGQHFRASSIRMAEEEPNISSSPCCTCTAMDVDDVSKETVNPDELWRVSMELSRRCSIPPSPSPPRLQKQQQQHEKEIFHTNGSCYAATIG